MKKLIKLTPVFIFLLVASVAFGQGFEVPKSYAFNSPQDYEKYEETALSGISWLSKTPTDQYYEKKIEARKFLEAWMTGNPKFTVGMKPEIVNFFDKNPILKTVYMGGWAKYVIQNPVDVDEVKCYLAGIKAAIKYYDKMQSLENDPELDKLKRMQEKGELRKFIAQQLKSKS